MASRTAVLSLVTCRRTARGRLLPLVLAAAAAAGGCAGMGDSLLHPGGEAKVPNPAAPLSGGPTGNGTSILQSDVAEPQLEALTAALDRLNQTQTQLQLTLQDLQQGAERQADTVRATAEELQAARRGALVAGLIAAALTLVVLLLGVIVVRQSSQVKRALSALAEAEARAGGRGTAQESEGSEIALRTGRAAAAGTARADGAPGGSVTGASAAGNTGAGSASQAARLRKRPPVG